MTSSLFNVVLLVFTFIIVTGKPVSEILTFTRTRTYENLIEGLFDTKDYGRDVEAYCQFQPMKFSDSIPSVLPKAECRGDWKHPNKDCSCNLVIASVFMLKYDNSVKMYKEHVKPFPISCRIHCITDDQHSALPSISLT